MFLLIALRFGKISFIETDKIRLLIPQLYVY